LFFFFFFGVSSSEVLPGVSTSLVGVIAGAGSEAGSLSHGLQTLYFSSNT
jgi:hypothetical protein